MWSHRLRRRHALANALLLLLLVSGVPVSSTVGVRGTRQAPLATAGGLGRGCLCPLGSVPQLGGAGPGELRLAPSAEAATDFLAQRTVGKHTVLLVMANRGNSELVDNLLCSLKAVRIKHYVLFASDPESYRYYHGRGYAGAFYDASVFQHELPAEALEIQDGPEKAAAWADLLRSRVSAVAYVLNKGFDVLFSDADVVFHRDVTRTLDAQARNLDALFMWDGPTSGKQYPAWANAGFYFLRATSASRQFLEAVLRRLAEVPPGSEEDDQTVLNKVLAEAPPKLAFRLLDNSTFLCGHTLKTHVAWPGHKLKASKGPATVSQTEAVNVVHVNWTGSLAEKKRLLLRAGFWHMCHGMGSAGFEQHLRDNRQWFDAEGLAARKGKRQGRGHR